MIWFLLSPRTRHEKNNAEKERRPQVVFRDAVLSSFVVSVFVQRLKTTNAEKLMYFPFSARFRNEFLLSIWKSLAQVLLPALII